tara:strand:+ start:3403 stop:4338 length:936 start_codon:yes stop_codon:yes gene_type:complete
MGKENLNKSIASNKYSYINSVVVILQVCMWFGLITLLHGSFSIWFKIPTLILFCFMMQGVFSMMHECFHGHGFNNTKVNWFMGWLTSTLFGSLFTLPSVYHDGHHLRNRSRSELGEYIFPDESALKKISIYYFAILGGLWLVFFIASLLLPFFPLEISRFLTRYKKNNTYAHTFEEFKLRDWNLMRLELVLSVLFWIGVIYFANWDWMILVVCYAIFAFSWSSLQWIYHIGTPLHPIEGAYNLRLPRWIRLLFLNFNYNLTHHRYPGVPWYDLYKVSNQKETQPLWYRYIRVFLPPKPLPKKNTVIEKTYF